MRAQATALLLLTSLASMWAVPATAQTATSSQGTASGQSTTQDTIDLWVERVQRWFDPERQGFFPWVGSVLPGGWLAVGGGYRQDLALGIRVDALAGISLRNYKLLDAGITVPITSDDSVVFDVRTRLVDATRVHLFGVGNDSSKDDLGRFGFEPKRLDARVRVRPQDGVEVGGSVGVLSIDTGPGAGGRSIDEVFLPEEVPGLGDSASYVTFGLFGQADLRDARDFTRRGGWYRAEWTAFADGDDEDYGHQRFDLDLRQFFPVFDERQAVLARLVFSGTNAGGSDTVPHFMMPVLGDGENLRGFANQRFTDRQRLLLQSEYRYRVRERLHVAGLIDLGRVAPSVGDLGFGGLHPSYGAGLRMQTPEGMGIRADVVRSSEQWAFVVSSVVF